MRRTPLLLAALLAGSAAACGRAAFLEDSTGGSTPLPHPSIAPTASPSPTPTGTPGVVMLIAENFMGGNAGLQAETVVVWDDDDSSAGSFEVYDAAGAGARGMKGTYDADNNAGTAQVNIPGGLEVNDTSTDTLLTATFTMPALAPGDSYTGGTLTLFAGNRGNPAGTQTIEIVDTTSGGSISGILVPTLPTGGAPRDWVYNSKPIPFASSKAGHVIVVRFQGSGTAGEGLEIADLLLRARLN